MIRPVMKDDEFLADVKAAEAAPGTVHLWWLGQSGFLAKWNGKHLLLDPYLSDSLTEKYARTDKPHVRMTERIVEPARLDFVDVVTSSHNHTDHLDAQTLLPLRQASPNLRLVIPEANRSFVRQRLAVEGRDDWIIGLDDDQKAFVSGIEFIGIPAAHEQFERDEQGRCLYLGYIIRLGDFWIYHSGDTVRYEGMVERLSPWQVDIALLPINGRAPERRVAGNLDGHEAASLARAIGAKLVIPCHFDMFEFNTASPDVFAAECEHFKQPYRIVRCGERVTSVRCPL